MKAGNDARSIGVLLGLLLLAAACGGRARSETPPNTESGGAGGAAGASGGGDAGAETASSRLAPWQLESSGMPPLVLGVYDGEQHVHCEFMADSAGNLRCLPLVPDELPDHNQFADATCKSRIYAGSVFAAPTTEPVSIPLSDGAACPAVRHVVGRLTPLPIGSVRYETDQQGACVSSSFVPDEPEVVLTDLSAPEQWVAGVDSPGVLLGGRLRVREAETPEGAHFPISLFDERWKEPCSAAGEYGPCWPKSVLRFSTLFSDQECESTVWSSDSCVTPPFESDNAGFFTLKPYSGPLFQSGGLGCLSAGSSDMGASGLAYYSRAAELDDPDVLVQPKQAYVGDGRFQHPALEDDLGQPVTVTQSIWPTGEPIFQDGATGYQCQPVWTPSGVRCLPSNVRFDSGELAGFADASCVEPAYYCPDLSCDGDAFVPTFSTVHGLLHADVVQRAKDIGAQYWTRVEGVCTPGALPLVYYRADGEIPWDQYPELTELNGDNGGS